MPIKIKPPTGVPTAASARDEEAWSALVDNQLVNVRKSAENWRNGLAAIITLITAFSAIKGPDSVSGLERWAGVTVGILLLLALVSAVLGAWSSLAAAYGAPEAISREEFRRIGWLSGFKLDLATKSVSNLHRAQWATLAAVLLFAAAIGLTWYGPRSATAILEVERKSQPTVCGQLVASQDGHLDLLPPTYAPVRVELADVAAVRAVGKCP